MLKKISPVLSPEAVKLMMEMGHGDTLLLADANYPATTNNERVIRADGLTLTQLLEAILELLPLDMAVEAPVTLMATGTGEEPSVWAEFRTLLADAGETREMAQLDRFAFYEAGRKAAGVIQSGDTTLFGNIMLQKGTL